MIKNGESTKLLNIIKKADKNGGVSKLDDADVTEALFLMYALKKTIEEYEDSFKDVVLARGLQKTVHSEFELKAEIKEGRSTSEYDVQTIFNKLPIEVLSKITNIVDAKVKANYGSDELVRGVVEANKISKPSDKKIVTVSKLTADEKKLLHG
jgi:hypothetical protein